MTSVGSFSVILPIQENCNIFSFCLWATKKIFSAVLRMNSNPHINHGESRVYHQFRRNCISSMRSIVYHQAADRCTLKRDEIQPQRGWWYAPRFARWWYAKPVAWIKKEVTFVYQKLLLFWRRSGDLNPGARIIRPNGLANRPLRPAWVLLQIVFGFLQEKDHLSGLFLWRRERDSNPCGISPKRFSRPPRYDHFDIPPKQGRMVL